MNSSAGYGIVPPGFRLPGDIRLGPVRLQVSDLERSLAFYRDILGFRVIRQEDGGVALGAAGSDEFLVELREGAETGGGGGRRRLGLYHVAYLLPSRADLGRLLRHLGESGVRMGASDHHVSEALYLQDPDGLGVEVYADRPRSTWRAEREELSMATVPLNLQEVLEAGGEARWNGMPEGTRVGHIHLHVGDLAEATAFYHEALGFDKVVWSYPGALFLSAGGYHHHLGMNTWAGPDARPAEADEPQLLEWTVELPDRATLEAAIHSFEEGGHQVESGVEDDGFVVRDPWGTRLRIRSPESGAPLSESP